MRLKLVQCRTIIVAIGLLANVKRLCAVKLGLTTKVQIAICAVKTGFMLGQYYNEFANEFRSWADVGWVSVVDGGSTWSHHFLNFSCLLVSWLSNPVAALHCKPPRAPALQLLPEQPRLAEDKTVFLSLDLPANRLPAHSPREWHWFARSAHSSTVDKACESFLRQISISWCGSGRRWPSADIVVVLWLCPLSPPDLTLTPVEPFTTENSYNTVQKLSFKICIFCGCVINQLVW